MLWVLVLVWRWRWRRRRRRRRPFQLLLLLLPLLRTLAPIERRRRCHDGCSQGLQLAPILLRPRRRQWGRPEVRGVQHDGCSLLRALARHATREDRRRAMRAARRRGGSGGSGARGIGSSREEVGAAKMAHVPHFDRQLLLRRASLGAGGRGLLAALGSPVLELPPPLGRRRCACRRHGHGLAAVVDRHHITVAHGGAGPAREQRSTRHRRV